MNTSKLIVAAAAALSVFGGATCALAQGTTTQTGQPQTQEQMQQQNTPANSPSTSQPSTGGTMNRADGYGTSGIDNRTGSMSTDSSSITNERVARADRN